MCEQKVLPTFGAEQREREERERVVVVVVVRADELCGRFALFHRSSR
jgi:hypothetical protein